MNLIDIQEYIERAMAQPDMPRMLYVLEDLQQHLDELVRIDIPRKELE